MSDGTGLQVSKRWDGRKGRMTLLAKSAAAVDDVAVEDAYPPSTDGVLCFARSGGLAPAATAADGKITWHLGGLRPGEVRELVYTALSPATLSDPAARKVPSPKDLERLEAMKDLPPKVIVPSAPAPAPPAPETSAPAKPLATVEPIHGTCRTVAIGAGKGGTGKTTFAINFAVALAELGLETVLLDADASMSNLGPYAGIDVQRMKATLHEVLAGEAEPEAAVYRAFSPRLRIVPSGLSVAGFLKADRGLLADVIGHFAAGADCVVIDTPAGYNREVALSLQAADDLLLVLNPDEGSMIDGLKVQEMARILGVDVRGIVLNRCDMAGCRYTPAQVEAHFGTSIVAMLPEDANARRKDRMPAVLASPGSRTAQEIVKVARLVAGKEVTAQAPRPFAARLMEALFRP